jgi:PAS domain S-box-containing protein
MTEQAHATGVGRAQDFGALVDGLGIMVWTALPNGALDFVNQHVLDYFGRSFEQMIEWGWVEVVHPDDLAETGERWSYALESGEPYRMEFRLKRARDGAFRRHVAEALPSRDAQGKITHWFGYCSDVDAVKSA